MRMKVFLAVCAMIAALCLTGCVADAEMEKNSTAGAIASDVYGESDVYVDSDEYSYGYGMEESVQDNGSVGTIAEGTYVTGIDTTAKESDYAQKLIQRYIYRYQTTEFEKSLQDLNDKVLAHGGYVEYMETYDYGKRTAELMLRIPKEQAESFLSEADGIGEIVYQSVSTEDVTLQYYDATAHLETLRTQHERLLELLAEAQDLDAMITLQSELAEAEYEINSFETTIRVYDNKVNYVSIEVTLNEVEQIQVVEKDTFFTRITKNLSKSFDNVGSALEGLVIFLVSAIPYLLVLAVLVGIVVTIIKVSIYRHKKKRMSKAS